ncbi:cation diffusion facilitator family transporter [Paracoccus luteus]|uniref:cation diffusion facilitator family transporter n=1 Tax=Paracoccus luteus TaxID=2508543 RepID=UPI00106FE620|nr:cation diffusion facilitator family transporter [Paracoccus luteus]
MAGQGKHNHGHGHGHDHGQGHGHDHGPGGHGHDHAAGLGDRALVWAVAINLVLTGAQIVGGLAADSVALVADGVHNLSDALALVLAFGARRLAQRPPSPTMSFGWSRAEIVAAFANYLALIAVSVWLMVEAFGRLADPPPVAAGLVMALAGLALVVDLGTAALTMRLARDSLNIRAAFMHNLADAGVSVAVLLGGVLIWAFGWRLADPLLTLGISVVILWHLRGDLMRVLRLLMLGAPGGVDPRAVADTVTAVPGVASVHHLHLWQIDERRLAADMHLVVSDGADPAATLRAAKTALGARHAIAHATIELETAASGCADDALRA